MKRAITPDEMRRAERSFMDQTGFPSLLLMEHAAEAVRDALLQMTDGGAVFLCGPGNNGGDGYAAARLFAQKGRKAVVWAFCDPEALRGDALVNARLCHALGVSVERWQPGRTAPAGCGAAVDALFGTGLSRPLEGEYAEGARFLNACDLPVLAVDMPSGTRELMVQARVTVTFHCAKICHCLFPGREKAGRLIVADIGLPPQGAGFELLEDADIPRLLPSRAQTAHKGSCGHALVLAGSFGMAGAAALCATAALRAGAGLCTVACPRQVVPAVQALCPCATALARDEIAPETLLEGITALAAGPGLGRAEEDARLLAALRERNLPQVWDADALNLLSRHPAPLGENAVMTPHPGEAARLLGCATGEIVDDPVRAAERLRETYACTVLLKGATTVILGPGRRAFNLSGTPGLATGGSGDVLTGVILGLLCQGLAPFDAAQLGAFLHGRAGERAAAARGVRGMIASDLPDALGIE